MARQTNGEGKILRTSGSGTSLVAMAATSIVAVGTMLFASPASAPQPGIGTWRYCAGAPPQTGHFGLGTRFRVEPQVWQTK